MKTRSRSVSAMAIVAAVAGLTATYTVKASSQAGQTVDPMTALLAEVHGLRMAMEQSATITPRVQLTLARLNIEEQRITQLAVQLDQVRRELSAASLESQKLSDQLPELEKGLLTLVSTNSSGCSRPCLARRIVAKPKSEVADDPTRS